MEPVESGSAFYFKPIALDLRHGERAYAASWPRPDRGERPPLIRLHSSPDFNLSNCVIFFLKHLIEPLALNFTPSPEFSSKPLNPISLGSGCHWTRMTPRNPCPISKPHRKVPVVLCLAPLFPQVLWALLGFYKWGTCSHVLSGKFNLACLP